MKILIWFGCFFVSGLIQVAMKNQGITLGMLPVMALYGLSYWAARTLCLKWDERKSSHEES